MTIADLIIELKKQPNWNVIVTVHGTLNYPFQHAPIIKVIKSEDSDTIYLEVKKY